MRTKGAKYAEYPPRLARTERIMRSPFARQPLGCQPRPDLPAGAFANCFRQPTVRGFVHRNRSVPAVATRGLLLHFDPDQADWWNCSIESCMANGSVQEFYEELPRLAHTYSSQARFASISTLAFETRLAGNLGANHISAEHLGCRRWRYDTSGKKVKSSSAPCNEQ
jgi:hypothetical protein